MKADGSIVRCSSQEEKELFSLVLGGYGLFGVILDVELSVVPNERYRHESEVLPADRYVARFLEKVRGQPDIGMVYGRLSIVPGQTFLREAILTVFRRAPCKPEEIPALGSTGLTTLRREVFRRRSAAPKPRKSAGAPRSRSVSRSPVDTSLAINCLTKARETTRSTMPIAPISSTSTSFHLTGLRRFWNGRAISSRGTMATS